jgi:hypothetical protein
VRLSLQGILQAARGNEREVEKTLQKLLRIKSEKYISGANIATVYAAAGNYSEAMDWLEIALTEHDPYLTWLKFDKEFHSLRGNPRFQKILEKIGFSETDVKQSPAAPTRLENPRSGVRRFVDSRDFGTRFLLLERRKSRADRQAG